MRCVCSCVSNGGRRRSKETREKAPLKCFSLFPRSEKWFRVPTNPNIFSSKTNELLNKNLFRDMAISAKLPLIGAITALRKGLKLPNATWIIPTKEAGTTVSAVDLSAKDVDRPKQLVRLYKLFCREFLAPRQTRLQVVKKPLCFMHKHERKSLRAFRSLRRQFE